MRFLFAALIALAVGTGATLLAQRDPGYVLIRYLGWSVESSLVLFALLLTLAFLLFYLLVRLLARVWHLPLTLRHWLRQRRLLRAHRETNRGLIALAEGNWSQAERRLSHAAARTEAPLLNYLSAARAAQKQHASARRDQYLAQAYRSMPKAKLAIGLTQAELQLDEGQLEQALASLLELERIAPRHPYVLHLLKRLYEQMHSWEDLYRLLPELRRQHVLSAEQLDRLEPELFHRLLDTHKDPESLQQRWQAFPASRQREVSLLHHYARRLLELGATGQAEQLLQHALEKAYTPALVDLYGTITGGDPVKRLQLLERWLKEHERDADLLLAAGRQCLHSELWGKARSYLEASLGQKDRPETRHELAELLIRLDEKDHALTLYRKGSPR